MGRYVWFQPGYLARLELPGSHRKAVTMAATQVWRTARMIATTSPRGSLRAASRLWTLLHAPALDRGPSGVDSAAAAEDDYRRFAAAPRGY